MIERLLTFAASDLGVWAFFIFLLIFGLAVWLEERK